jgi:hypothetical protein
MKAEEGKPFTMKTMAKIRNKIEGWWVAALCFGPTPACRARMFP